MDPGRTRLAASVRIGTVDAPKSGSISVGRERVSLLVGEKHLKKLDTILDPLVVTDLATMVWSPHGYPEAVDALRQLAQIALLDSQDEQDVERALARADSLSTTPTWWTWRGCARRRGASGSRPRSTRRGGGRT